MSHAPLLLIGLDGVDFRYLDQFSEMLPQLGRLRDDGTETALESTHPPWTASAWPSLYTGLDPSHHGVFDFFDYAGTYPAEATVVTRQDVHAPAVWNYLTQQELTSVVVNVPVTHPADEIDGVQIPGYLAPDDEPGSPPEIREELEAELGVPYRIYSEFENDDRADRKIEGYRALIERRGIAAAHLLESTEWDFAFVQVQKTDAVFHNSSSVEDFESIYRTADEFVGRLREACSEPTNIVVCSDHGMGPVTGSTIYINELLRKQGYIETTTGTTTRSISTVKGNDSAETDGDQLVDRAVSVGRTLGLGPERLYRIARRLTIASQLRQFVPESIEGSLTRDVDWRQSMAYCRRPSEQGIRINLQERDPAGVVPADRYEPLREEIIEQLSGLTTGCGEPLFEFVCRREDLYDGPYADHACDILFRTAEMNHKISTSLPGETLQPVETYNHKPTGVFVATGPDINAEWTASSLSVVDVAPILFTLLEQPVPERLSGQAPSDLTPLDTETRAYDDLTVETDAYTQDQSEVTDRLRDLGYL